jgi:hypothetical protein
MINLTAYIKGKALPVPTARLVKMEDHVVSEVKMFDPYTGKAAEALTELCRLDELEYRKAQLQQELKDIDVVIADFKALPRDLEPIR